MYIYIEIFILENTLIHVCIMKKNTVRMDEFSWEEMKELLENGYNTVVFGIGATEQHGPALPLKSDSLQADETANLIAKELPKTLQAPTILVGYSKYHMNFPGTITLRESTLQAIIEDYIDSFAHHGFENIIIYISHGGDVSATEQAIQTKQAQYPKAKIFYYYTQDAMPVLSTFAQEMQLSPGALGGHADHREASMILLFNESLVNKQRLLKGYTGNPNAEIHEKMHSEGTESVSKNGILGDQRGASKEFGEKYLKLLKPVMMNYIKKKLED